MDFELTNEQKDIIKAAREFAEGEFPQIAQEYDQKEEFPMNVWKKACELGFVGLYLPEEYGGAGLGAFEHALALEEFWRVDPGCGSILLTAFGSRLILLYGTEEQKKKFIPPLTKGDAIMGTAVTEPDAGSDILGIRTTAKKDGDEYVINGTKMFVTSGTIADYIAVFCVTNPEAEARLEQHGIVMVEMDRPGVERTKITGKMGVRASDTAEIVFTDVRVPIGNIIGDEGCGFRQIMEQFNFSRIEASAQAVGLAQGAMEKAIIHVKKREAFGKTIAEFQGTQFKLAKMGTLIEAARGLYHRAAWSLDNVVTDHKLIAMAKYFAGEVAKEAADEALQMHGGYGYIAEYGMERLYRDAKIIEIYEATKEIEKITIARSLLK
ncbi:MAG: acyl-CoA dehydrogenase family protein [Deltaproteobacteria bacterium]|nr:acyl-CoA dehydrogenase family protein [Deltaproteobacteria bacterium]